MLYIGMDVHVKRSSICVLDENGKQLMAREVKGNWEKAVEEIKRIGDKYLDYMSICFEASCGAGHLHDRLQKVARRVVVANPGKVRLIFKSKRKNDRIDAQKLAKLLFLDQVPTVHVPSPHIRAWRNIIEHRGRLVAKRTRTKNEIRSLLRENGLPSPYKLWTRKGIAWLKSIRFEDPLSAYKLTTLIGEFDFFEAGIRAAERILAKEASRHPGVRLLMTIPGVGIRTAEALAAYIDDPGRFDKTSKIGAYLGLVPVLDSSAGRDRLGHITKEGPPTVRKLLTEAAWAAIRRSEKVRARFERIVKGDPDRKKIAVIAIAHYLARVGLAMLRTGECWSEAA